MGALKSKTEDATPCTEPMPVKAARTYSKSQSKEAAPTVQPVKLPTKSRRALLQEQPLNADAKPFIPSEGPGPSTPPKTKWLAAASAPVAAPVVAEDEPEWMQYLSKKLSDKATQRAPPPDPPPHSFSSGRRALRCQGAAGRGGGKGGGIGEALPAADEGRGPDSGAGIVIHTGAYLKLLKEGEAKKKASNTSAARHAGINKTIPSFGQFGLSTEATMPQQSQVALTTLSLARSWSSWVEKKPGPVPEEEVVLLSTQDDMCISRSLLDQDLSDPAYYSDTESQIKKSASIHRLGHRPKVTTSTVRTYVMQDLSFRLDEVVGMMLLRLQQFTDRQRIFSSCSSEENQAQPRRFVIGLKEVARRTKQSKVECVIVAPDIDQDANNGGLDDRMRELLALAYQKQTPIIFALSRSRLGKALGKSLHISVLGVLDARGAQDLLRESVKLASHGCQTWLARIAK